ncbi:MAG: hypothetical protein BGO26_13025 [Actinobacteria bacterium 69-20]|jgi:excisionase family DNA binding protein|nr:hypothetical protein [Actinomycetota bacterium]OJV23602.1 MAG: hypothetical protein BGO26_13025 [Actinobacteria bacterium 69-20]
MTTKDAASLLGVGARQIQRLVASGRLHRADVVGASMLIDARSAQRLHAQGVGRGRPWSSETVQAALDFVRMGTTGRLGATERSRLKARLRGMSAPALVRATARRSSATNYRASASFLAELREHLVLTAGSAVDADAGIAAALGLAGSARQTVDGYVDRSGVAKLVERFFLVEDPGGNVTLRVAGGLPEGRVADLVTVALDLAGSLDPRERAAGLAFIGTRLAALR